MKYRIFRFNQPVLVMVYCNELLKKGIEFTVKPGLQQWCDVQTPPDLAEDDFPLAHWLA